MEATQGWGEPLRKAVPTQSDDEAGAAVSGGPSWVIRRKIVPPPLSESVVPRLRLETLLNGLLDQHRLVCVYASAGAGKTTAILQAAQRLQRPLAWLDLDATDVSTGRLLVYLEAALALHVPQVTGVAAAALAAQLPHAEVAGLLAESVGDRQLLVVLDDAERLAGDPEAVDVLGAFARYLPPSARLIIASRVELPFRSSVGASPWVAAIGEEDLALTVEEASAALAASGRADIDPVDAIVETGGWMTGVLFEAWRAPDHVLGLGGEADPLHGYLSTEILGQLSEADAEFLISTSVLTEVTAAHAQALGVAHSFARMHSLSRHRLPVSWSRSATVMLCHPRFREFLLKRLARRPEHEQRELHRAHARLLSQEHHDEEAVQEYLGAGLLAEALAIIHPVVERLIERTDFGLAERWLETLAPVRGEEDISLAAAELMLAVVREDFGAGIALADRLEKSGQRQELAGSSARAAGFMAWCYLHAGRVEDIDRVLDVAPQGPDLDAVRYAMAVVRDEPADIAPSSLGALSGGPMDALVLRAHFDFGRLGLLTAVPQSPWAAKAAESWMVSALLTTGHTERAFELYHRLVNSSDQSVWLLGLLGPRLMLEVGDHAEAWRLLHEGRRRIQATGSVMFETYSLLIEAEFELRLHKDPAAAHTVLERLAAHPVGSRYAFLVEQRDMLAGLAELYSGAPRAAAAHLRRAVESMQRGERLLHLPVAAVYLSEAEWRCGREEAADVAAETARVAARRQGSEHMLLSVLTEFPDVLARRIDLEPGADSEWHQLGRALLVRGVQGPEVGSATVEVVEFGRTALTIDGSEVNPGLSKSVELLAYLANAEREEVSRQRLLDALFEGRRDTSTTAYLRQASLKLRKAVPDVLDPTSRPGTLRLSPSARVATESRRLIGLLGEATSVRGEERLRLLVAALDIADRGPYLPTVASVWAEDRRQRLDELVRSARLEAAEVACTIGQLGEARRLAEQVVATDPYREAAWRLLMRLAAALGDHDRVIAAYRRCEEALREIGAQPSGATAALLRDFRH
ncbi:MAG: transcriptional activator domain protein [Blastococcus sp.]|jgi:DNA-binding SARP family transcriptional activator|nr:transcriptional activator domain protein [Blastococcus sp.]